MKLLVATSNAGKVRELERLLGGLAVTLVSVKDVGAIDVVEDGETFEANAAKKACAYRSATGLPTLADDSGLEVDALGGAPGVRSARYAGEHASDADNVDKLLSAMRDLDERSARFRCVLALAMPGEDVLFANGACEGRIARERRGTGGFGYDPVFVVDGADGRTMAELSPEEKDARSHRGRAMRAMAEMLETITAKNTDR